MKPSTFVLGYETFMAHDADPDCPRSGRARSTSAEHRQTHRGTFGELPNEPREGAAAADLGLHGQTNQTWTLAS
jgi:hypothetical protein